MSLLPKATHHWIAVIGIGCILPGATGPRAFWQLLKSGGCAVQPVPDDRWNPDDVARAAQAGSDHAPPAQGGFIEGAGLFDAEFFGLSPREARLMDPRQQLALKTAWWALEDAGLPGWSLRGQPVGVFLGASNSEFGGFHVDLSALGQQSATGIANSILSNRLSYVLGVTGPSLVVDTACSASLVAVHLACASLRAGECNVALAGGISLMLRPEPGVAFGRAGMMARDGRCKTFSADADGYGRGEGSGIVVLKPLAAAERDGDSILGVILGSAVNHNGQSNGITAPSSAAQEALIRQALAAACTDPARVVLAEAHGTGTLLGDPIEARALGRALGQAAGRESPLLLGAVKSNIGHLEAAAGIAGLIKLLLCLKHGEVPPALGVERPNPHIDFARLGLSLPAAATPLPGRREDRIGVVSSFGFGGANCHMVVAAAPAPAPAEAEAPWPELLVLSAATEGALGRLAEAAAAEIEATPGAAAAFCRASHRRRSPLGHRLALVATDPAALATGLREAARGRTPPRSQRAQAPRRPPMLAMLFPGQGVAYAEAARALAEEEPAVRDALAEAEAACGLPLRDALRDGSFLRETALGQPLTVALQEGQRRLWAAWGIRPDLVLGHSLGDFAAAVAAGALSFADALRLVAARGRLMAELASAGGMAAVTASAAEVLPHLAEGVAIAVENDPGQIVVSGAQGALEATLEALRHAGLPARPLPAAAAFHSPAMDPVLEPFGGIAAEVAWQALRLPMACNRTGTILPAGTVLDAGFWIRHLREPVRFVAGVAAVAEAGVKLGLELGPNAALSRLVPALAPGIACFAAVSQREPARAGLLSALGGLWAHGIAPDWAALARPHGPASLPPYPFDKSEYPLQAEGTVQPCIQPAPRPPPPVVPLAPAAPTSGGAEVLAELLAIIAELLETTPDRVDPAAAFLEMGADSLVLVGAIKRIEARFGIRVPLRALFEEFCTAEALAAHLVAQRAAEARTRPEPKGVAPVPAVAAPAPEQDDVLAEVVRAQLEIMRQQLDLLQQAPAAAPLRPMPAPPRRPAPARTGPAETAPPDPRQQAHLNALVAAVTALTPGSKALAARARPVMADSRASAGFRHSIKEMLYPIVARRARGARFEDVDGNRYLDISMGFGVHMFGHMPDFLTAALQESLSRGLRLGPQSDRACEVAERLARLSGQDRVAFLNSGTEAVMVALRLARTVTGRRKVVIFRGAYHGHFDGILAQPADPDDPLAGSVPLVAGVAEGAVADTLVLDYGDEASLNALQRVLGSVAAVLVEPVQSRRPDLQPAAFLHRLRNMTRAAGAVLVFDELITGFRIAPGGAQEHFGVRADLVAYGKVLGGGLPVGAIAGRAELMAAVDGGVWSYGDRSMPSMETTLFAGTFNKNPLSMDAAAAVLAEIARQGPALQAALNARAERLEARLQEVLAGTPIRMVRFGSVFRFAFSRNLDPFFYHLLLRGIYIWEGRTCFLSTAHTDADCEELVAAVAGTVSALREGGIIEPAPTPPGPRITLAQRQLATLARMEGGAASYAVPLLVELQGVVDVPRLSAAIAQVARRHDSLWTPLDALDGAAAPVPPTDIPVELRDLAPGEFGEAVRREVARPLDLARPPLLRAMLLRTAPDRVAMLLLGHHAALDGLSMQVLAAEIAEASARRPLPAATSIGVLAEAHARAEASGAWDAARAWWRSRLQGAPAGLDLDVAAERPPVRAFRGARLLRAIPPELAEDLRRRAVTERVTLLALLLGGFARVLARRGRTSDLVIGVPYAGRAIAGAGAERLVGFCTHLLPLRLRLEAGEDAAASVRTAQAALLEALEHADYPFAQILQDLAVRRDPARPVLVPMTFNLDRVQAMPEFGPGIAVRLLPVPAGFARFDLACNVVDFAGSMTVELDYDAELFAEDSVALLLDDFVAGLRALARQDAAPQASVWARPPPVEEFGPPLLDRFRALAAEEPRAPAVALDGALRLDRAGLDAWSDRIAAAIVAAPGGPGPVAAILARTEAMAAALVGCWKAGRAWVPIEPGMAPARLPAQIRAAGCAVALVEEGVEKLPGPAVRLPPMGETAGSPVPSPVPDPASTAYILFTSGSTGRPKPIAVPHRAVTAYLDGLLRQTGLPQGACCALMSTFAADLGLTAVLPALFHGGVLHVVGNAAARDPQLLAAAVRRMPADLMKIVPSHLEALLSGAPDPAMLPRRLLVLGGERASPALLRRLAVLAPAELVVMNHYGPTEATIGVAMGLWERGQPELRLDAPLAGARVALLDESGAPVAPGATGEIHVGGPQLADGYVGMSEETGARFAERPLSGLPGRLYATGDFGRLDAEGRLEVLGRRDDQVKIRGYRVEPAEVAAALGDLPMVAAGAVLVAEQPGRGPALVAHVVPRGAEATPQAVLHAAQAVLPDHMLPAAVMLHAALPLTPNGKLDRAALPAPDSAALWGEATAVRQPGSERVEQELLACWRRLFGQAEISRYDDFFALGGDSMLAIRMVAQLHQAGLLVRTADVYRHPTLATLAPHVHPAVATAEQGRLEGELPLLPSQHRWLARGPGLAPHANLSVLLRMAPGVTPEGVQRAFARLLEQHDGLRLRARQEEGRVAQGFAAPAAPPLFRVAAGEDEAAALARVQAMADPAGDAIVLAWLEPDRLLVVFHHWLVDAVSMMTLLEDLAKLVRDPAAELGPKTLSLRQWIEALARLAASPPVLDQLDAWALAAELPPPDLPASVAPAPAAPEALAVTLDAAETAAVLSGPAVAAGLEPSDVMLAALTSAMAELAGSPLLYVELEGHGRTPPEETPEPARTVGWLTSRYPAWFDLEGVPPERAVTAIHEQRGLISSEGRDYGALRWLGPPEARARLAAGNEPAVSFNYLGQLAPPDGAPFEVLSWRPGCPARGPELAARHARPHALSVEAMLDGEALCFEIACDPPRLDPALLMSFAERFQAELVALASLPPRAEDRGAATLLQPEDLASLMAGP